MKLTTKINAIQEPIKFDGLLCNFILKHHDVRAWIEPNLNKIL